MLELHPTDNRKSFYGKATLRTNGNETILTSYSTDVCKVVNGKFVRLWDGYSATTQRHVNAFLDFCGISGGGKSWWNNQKVAR